MAAADGVVSDDLVVKNSREGRGAARDRSPILYRPFMRVSQSVTDNRVIWEKNCVFVMFKLDAFG